VKLDKNTLDILLDDLGLDKLTVLLKNIDKGLEVRSITLYEDSTIQVRIYRTVKRIENEYLRLQFDLLGKNKTKIRTSDMEYFDYVELDELNKIIDCIYGFLDKELNRDTLSTIINFMKELNSHNKLETLGEKFKIQNEKFFKKGKNTSVIKLWKKDRPYVSEFKHLLKGWLSGTVKLTDKKKEEKVQVIIKEEGEE